MKEKVDKIVEKNFEDLQGLTDELVVVPNQLLLRELVVLVLVRLGVLVLVASLVRHLQLEAAGTAACVQLTVFGIAVLFIDCSLYYSLVFVTTVTTVFLINQRLDLHEAMTLTMTFEETKYGDMQKGLNLAKQT